MAENKAVEKVKSSNRKCSMNSNLVEWWKFSINFSGTEFLSLASIEIFFIDFWSLKIFYCWILFYVFYSTDAHYW